MQRRLYLVWRKELIENLRTFSLKDTFRFPTGGYNIPLMLGILLVTVHLDWISKWGFGTIVGWTLLTTGTLLTLLKRYKTVKLDWITLIPLLLIILSTLISVLLGKSSLLSLVLLVVSLGLYFVGTLLGPKIFLFVIPLGLQISIASLIEGLRYINSPDGIVAGGMGLTGNSGLAGTIIGFAALLLPGNWLWLAIPLEVGLFFAGDHWSIIALVIVGIIMLIKRDYYFKNTKVLISLVLVGLVLTLGFWPSGTTQKIWGFTVSNNQLIAEPGGSPVDLGLNDRVRIDLEVVKDVSIVGKGIQSDTPTKFDGSVLITRYQGMVHNIPIMILDDLGPIAAVAWVFLVVLLILKYPTTRYIWAFILVTSLFSYWWWIPTAIGSWFFTLVGTTVYNR